MRILVLGTGGREHALLQGLSRDAQKNDALNTEGSNAEGSNTEGQNGASQAVAHELHVCPGNPGMENLATRHTDAGSADDAAAMVALAQKLQAELVVIGPEAPLVAGVADALREAGFAVFGPNKDAARIEGSKAFAKDVMAAAGVATARAEQITPGASEEEIARVLQNFGPNYVVKDDGLAGGKGVVVTQDYDEAVAHIHAVHEGGNPVLLESFLSGPEVSLFCLVDGEDVVPLLPAQDHKRAYDNDEGPNTGGMGAYTPLPWLPEDGVQRIVDEVCRPVAKELVARGCSYSGLLYAGLAWGEDGPAVVEFNCRFGDPETQAVLAMLQSPLAPALAACANGTLAELAPLEWHEGSAVTVVLAASGYPASPRKGDRIVSDDIENPEKILHGGTSHESGEYYSNGGRVLNVIGKGADLDAAREAAYQTIGGIQMAGGFYRRDIGAKAARGEISI